MDVYDEMAEFYDLVYNDDIDLEFYLREARNARGPVLEVACGTGRILLEIMKDGIDITGIDLSENMLAVLKEKAAKMNLRPNVMVANMVDFKLDRKFKLIIVPYRSILHISKEEQKKALQNFIKHLDKGGRLIVHTYDPSEEERAMVGRFHHYESNDMETADGKKYHLDWYLHYEPETHMAHYKIIIKFEDGKNKEYRMDVQHIAIKEMHELLSSYGCRNVRVYGDFEYYPFDESCQEAIWIAEK